MLEQEEHIPLEWTAELIRFAREVDNPEIQNYFRKVYLRDILKTQSFVPVELAVELIKLALESKEHDPASIESFYRKNITLERCYFGLLPVDSIVALRQLTQTFGDDALLQKINERLGL